MAQDSQQIQQVSGGTVTFQPAHVTAKEAREEYLGGILNGESIVSDAKGELLQVMGFSDGKGGYVSAANGNTGVITKDSIKQISIEMPPDANGVKQTRYFRQIDHMDGTETKYGLKATAWEETDKSGKHPVWVDKDGNPTAPGKGKQEIRVSFTGILEIKDKDALLTAIGGDLDPKAIDTVAFTDRVIRAKSAEVGKANLDMIYSSHSSGSIDTRAARALSDIEGVASTNATLMLESGDIGDKQVAVLRHAMNDPNSAFYKKMQEVAGPANVSAEKMHKEGELLDSNNIRFNAILQDKDGEWHGSHVANAQPGLAGVKGGYINAYVGAETLAVDTLIHNDHVLKGDLNTTKDRVVAQKVYTVPGWQDTSPANKAHEEVPMVYSAPNPDNYVVPVFTPDKTLADRVHAAVASLRSHGDAPANTDVPPPHKFEVKEAQHPTSAPAVKIVVNTAGSQVPSRN